MRTISIVPKTVLKERVMSRRCVCSTSSSPRRTHKAGPMSPCPRRCRCVCSSKRCTPRPLVCCWRSIWCRGSFPWTGQTTKPPAKRTLAGNDNGHHRRRGLAHPGRAEKRGGRRWWEGEAKAGAEPAAWQQSCDALPTVISNLQSQARGAHPFRYATLCRSKTGIRSTGLILQGDGTEAPDEMWK